jgi:hypothetical protein
MPFVDILWKPALLPAPRLRALCEHLPVVVTESIQQFDPHHRLTAQMVDLRVHEVGPYDKITPDIYVTVLARTEPAREEHQHAIVLAMAERLSATLPPSPLVELVLTRHATSWNYGL